MPTYSFVQRLGIRALRAVRVAALGLVATSLCANEDSSLVSPTLAKLRNSGVITLGYRTALVPFSYLDRQMQPVGYTMDVCKRVVEVLRRQPGLKNLEVRHMAVTSGTRMPLVSNGSVDIECGATTNTAERSRSLNFSLTYFVAESRLLSKRSAPMGSIESLRGRSVVSTIGTTSIQLLHSLNRSQGLNLRIFGGLDDVDSFRLLESDQAVAFAMDDSLLRGLMATAKNAADYVISEQALSVEPYGLPLPPNDPVFKRLVDDALRELFASGDMRRIYERWFLSELPGKGVNLQLPMAPSLQKVIQTPTDSSDPTRYR